MLCAFTLFPSAISSNLKCVYSVYFLHISATPITHCLERHDRKRKEEPGALGESLAGKSKLIASGVKNPRKRKPLLQYACLI